MKYGKEPNNYTIYLKHKGFVYMQKELKTGNYSEVICTEDDMLDGSAEIMTAKGITRIVPKDKQF